jgi:hypothetical protein
MRTASTILMLTICLIVGCGGGSANPIAPASGVVTLDGKPIEGVSILLIPKEGTSSGRISYGLTDAEGRFELRVSPDQSGAIIGTHWVQLEKLTQQDGSPIPAGTSPEEVAAMNQLPQAYADAGSTPISAEIPESGTSDLVFDLSSRATPRPQ